MSTFDSISLKDEELPVSEETKILITEESSTPAAAKPKAVKNLAERLTAAAGAYDHTPTDQPQKTYGNAKITRLPSKSPCRVV